MKVLIPLAEGFEEVEFVTVLDILRRAEIEVVTAALIKSPVEGAHKLKVIADTTLDQVHAADFDALVLPGGFPGFVNLGNDRRVVSLVKEMDRAGKWIAAICGAPSVLVLAGVLKGRTATVNPAGIEQVSSCATYSPQRVVVDGRLVTSQAVGTALEFALRLVELWAGRERAKKIQAAVLARV